MSPDSSAPQPSAAASSLEKLARLVLAAALAQPVACWRQKGVRQSKVASLPAATREEVCRRMHDGHRAVDVIAYIHSLPDAVGTLQARFGEDWKVTKQNISAWRHSGFREWLSLQEANAFAKELGKCPQAPVPRDAPPAPPHVAQTRGEAPHAG